MAWFSCSQVYPCNEYFNKLTLLEVSVTFIPMYIESVPNRKSPPAVLLRESYREDGKVKKRTLANLSKWPDDLVEGLRTLLKGGVALPSLGDAFRILRSRPHGHVAAALGCARNLGLEKLLDRRASRERALAAAMILARILEPRSKLATARSLRSETLTHTLGEELGIEDAGGDELYRAMDWLLKRQDRIERHLAARHLGDGALVLCDVTSVYFEGSKCPLARLGYSRDGKRGKPQIVFALLTNREGCPVAVEVFRGNTADPGTLGAQLQKLRGRFSLSRVVLVGDRGLLTDARIREEVRPAGLEWITALRAPAIRKLVAGGDLQLSLFDEQDLAEITAPELYPGERLVVCRNPLLAAERTRKRLDLLAATEAELDKVVAATRRDQRPLRGKDRIAVRADRALRRYKVGKHFDVECTDDSFAWVRNEGRVAEEAALDGIYVIRTNVPADELGAVDAVRAYKGLSRVERAFRSYKTVDLKVRPVHHRLEGRVRAHVFLCMLAYYVEWHMRRALAPLLFDDDDPAGAGATRSSPVEPARPSASARAKAGSKRTPDGLPVHSFQTLLADLATLARNRVQPAAEGTVAADVLTSPTPLQAEAFRLLGVRP